MQYRGVLAEGTPVDIGAFGEIFPDGQKEIARGAKKFGGPSNNDYNVLLAFNGASEYNQTNPSCSSPETIITVTLLEYPDPMVYRCYNKTELDPSDIKKTIMWNTQGDYSPFMVVRSYPNLTAITTEYTYSKIHVSGSDIVLQEKYSKINMRLTLALFFFTLILLLPILFELSPKKILKRFGIDDKNGKSENNHPNNPQQEKPQDQQPTPKIPDNTRTENRPQKKHKHR